MAKYDKAYCEKSIRIMYKYIALCIIAMILSFVCVRYFGSICGIAIGVSFLFLCGAVIEIGKCKNILKELEKEKDGERVEQITGKLREEVEELREEVRVSKLNPLELEEERWEENAKDINLSFFENLKKDEVVKLVSGSYYYPSDDIHIAEFEYKHDFIDYADKSEHGVTIHGLERYDYADEWRPTTMLATDEETSTSSCSGTIKIY